MKLYFKDKHKKLRIIEADWQLEVVDDQQSVKNVVETAAEITPTSPVLSVVSPE